MTDHALPQAERTSFPAMPVSRWITAAAFAVPLCVLPSAAWRLSHVIGVAVNGAGPCDTGGNGELVYITGLSVISMSVALLTIGLVRSWGEVFPRWLPLVGGKTVPARGVTAVAGGGAALIGLLTVYAVVNMIFEFRPARDLPPGCEAPGLDVLVFYVPLIAWAPLLAVVSYAYYRRRTKA